MSTIFELYGYPIDSWNDEAWENLKRCNCPFMNAECDGGGNRFASGITLINHKELQRYFNGQKKIQTGVCSLSVRNGEPPWIVCPRRLMNFRNHAPDDLQASIKNKLYASSMLSKGECYKVWSEIKMKCNVTEGSKNALFDYTFDYIITACGSEKLSSICKLLGKSERQTKKILEENGMTIAIRDEELWCDEFPSKPLIIVEVMTSSTSGGNERNRTQVGQVFEDTIYKLAGKDVNPEGPGINYRQVWARMVSQLLVKSQIGAAWNGVTFWVIQDMLANYITKTTALNLNDFLSEAIDEVNIISGGYGKAIEPSNRDSRLIEISEVKMFSGPVSNNNDSAKAFVDIVKLGCTPDISELWKRLIEKKPCASFTYKLN